MSMPLLDPDFRLDERTDLLVFVHVPKCGGSSTHRFLFEATGRRYVNVYEQLVQDGLESQRPRLERAIGIGGHYGIDKNPALSFFPDRTRRYLSVVRDPVERFISHFRYFTRSPKSETLAQHPEVGQFSLKDFIAFLKRREDRFHANVQTRMLTGLTVFDDRAKAILKERYVGIIPTEHLFIFFRRFARYPEATTRSLEDIRWNVSPAVDDLKVDEESLAYIYNCSRQDLKLYHFAKQWFAEALIEVAGRKPASAPEALPRTT